MISDGVSLCCELELDEGGGRAGVRSGGSLVGWGWGLVGGFVGVGGGGAKGNPTGGNCRLKMAGGRQE